MADLDWSDVQPAFEEIGKRLDHIEAYLEKVGQQGFAYTRYGDQFGVPPEVRELARLGKTIEAIKLYRQATGVDLQTARAAVLSI